MNNDGSQGMPDAWSTYLATNDIKATADAAASHGGQILLPPMDVMDLGSMAMIGDPGGAAIGAWQAGLHKGFGLLAEDGAPGWFELQTTAYDDSVAFYRGVFGWDTYTVSDAPEFRYTTFGEGEDALAGIMDGSGFLPAGIPSQWSVYFQVSDTDAALVTIAELGGAVADPAKDTPYGRLATATDPTGARFKLTDGSA